MRQNAVFWIGFAFASLAALLLSGQPSALALTSSGGVNRCDAAADSAAKATGTPLDVLMAIARVESGRTVAGVLAPWPWAINQAGAGSFFDSAGDAVSYVSQALANGQRNIDVGCFQINVRWHGAEFPSLEAMFDPNANALYAARFLLRLHKEFGTWEGAIGAYHSRQSGAATAYLSKVASVMARPAPPPVVVQATVRNNGYPLLQPGKPVGHGSLVATTRDRPALPFIR